MCGCCGLHFCNVPITCAIAVIEAGCGTDVVRVIATAPVDTARNVGVSLLLEVGAAEAVIHDFEGGA